MQIYDFYLNAKLEIRNVELSEKCEVLPYRQEKCHERTVDTVRLFIAHGWFRRRGARRKLPWGNGINS